VNISLKHGLVSRTYFKKSIVMASIFGSKSKSFMTISIPPQGEPLIKRLVDARLSKFEVDFKQQQGEMTNKIDIVLKAINDQMTGALPTDTVKNPKLNVNPTSPVLSSRSYPMEDPQCSSYPLNLINAIKTCSKETNHS
ncbi:hypothetical protein Tco_0360618, partial [Tanacetum coccineum]